MFIVYHMIGESIEPEMVLIDLPALYRFLEIEMKRESIGTKYKEPDTFESIQSSQKFNQNNS